MDKKIAGLGVKRLSLSIWLFCASAIGDLLMKQGLCGTKKASMGKKVVAVVGGGGQAMDWCCLDLSG